MRLISDRLRAVQPISPVVVEGALSAFYRAHGAFPIHDVRQSFSFAARENSQMLRNQQAAHQIYHQARKSGRVDEDALKARSNSVQIAQQILDRRRLIHVQPTSWESHLHRQIIGHEKVHPLRNQIELIRARLGMGGMNKDCQAIVADGRRGRIILANIFRFHTEIPEVNGQIDVRKLPGNVDEIKRSSVEQLTGKENVTGYYSISSVLPKAGVQLITDLSSATPEGRLETTISPIRGFTGTKDRQILLAKSDDEIRLEVLKYLQTEKDDVRNFHVGNGAYLAWIHINRKAPEGSKDWITVNYIYDRSALMDNQKIYGKGEGLLPMSPVLYHESLQAGLAKAYNVCKQPLVSKPAVNSPHL